MPRKMFPNEKTFADFLDSQGLEWEYEPRRFDLGDSTYVPDFYVPSQKIYYEVVGTEATYYAHAQKRHFEKMNELYPDIKLKIVCPDGRLYSPPIPKGNAGRILMLSDPTQVRLQIPQEMIDQIDRMAAATPEATRSSMIRSLLRERIKQISEEGEGEYHVQ